MFDIDFIQRTKEYIRWGKILPLAKMNTKHTIYNRTTSISVDEYKRISEVLKTLEIKIEDTKEISINNL